MATDPSRRRFLSAALTCSVAQFIAPNAGAGIRARRMLGAWQSQGRDYAGIWQEDIYTRGVELPFRAHQVLLDPANPRGAIAIARRPGEFIARIDLTALQVTGLRAIEPEFVTNGHAVFSVDERTLLVSESDGATGVGSLGVYDVATLEIGERFPTAGIGPHALLREPGGTLLVANGGVVTLAQSGRTILNSGNIESSLVRLDSNGRILGEWRLVDRNLSIDSNGRVLGEWRLADRNLSIRHLALAMNGTVGVALQAEHADSAEREQAPVFALFDGTTLRIADPAAAALRGYAGDVACINGPAGPLFAVGCPRAGAVGIWTGAGKVYGVYPLRGACAVAPAGMELVAPSQHGETGRLSPPPQGQWSVSRGTPAWDNHVLIA
jgi:uncharacterized protein